MKTFFPATIALLFLTAPMGMAQTEAGQAEQGAQAPEQAVQQPVAAPQFTVLQLLQRGFEVKAMSFTNGAIVLTLQGGIDAFVCETDGMGNTRACVALK